MSDALKKYARERLPELLKDVPPEETSGGAFPLNRLSRHSPRRNCGRRWKPCSADCKLTGRPRSRNEQLLSPTIAAQRGESRTAHAGSTKATHDRGDHAVLRSAQMSSEAPAMSDALKKYARERLPELLKDVPPRNVWRTLPEKRLEGLSPEKRLEGLSPKTASGRLSPEELQTILEEAQRKLQGNGSSTKPQ